MLDQTWSLLAMMHVRRMHDYTPHKAQCVDNQVSINGYLMRAAIEIFVAINAFARFIKATVLTDWLSIHNKPGVSSFSCRLRSFLFNSLFNRSNVPFCCHLRK